MGKKWGEGGDPISCSQKAAGRESASRDSGNGSWLKCPFGVSRTSLSEVTAEVP